ncbi:MAG: flavin reductase family protein [Clostridia bacterium]|nr:flavin reductase family protein [Clostridia bacterium]
MEYTTDVFSKFDKQWALLTAGKEDDFNTMTISWGNMGTLWERPVMTVYVRTSRYTHDFMDCEDYFTVSFFPESCRDKLALLGSKSGRDIDKIHNSGLTAVKCKNSVSFKEAEVTFVCKKLFRQRLEAENMPKDVADTFYSKDALHDMYIGEVVEIIG